MAKRRKQGTALRKRPSSILSMGLPLLLAAVAGVGAFLLVRWAQAGPPVPAARADAGFDALKGRWTRLDGGYVVEIAGADASGKLDAAYFNPRPINVSKAQASHGGGMVRVFLELRDTGYPGCTYDLAYKPQGDLLEGVYYQAALQQSLDVVFARTGSPIKASSVP